VIHIYRLIDIGDKQLEVFIKGEGSPVIILPGMLCSIMEWESIAYNLSKKAKVILLNRAGCGKSKKGIKRRNVKENAEDLNKLLETLEIKKPILIGHSYGGLYLQYFINKYPKMAYGLILVDSTSINYHLLDQVNIEGEDENSTEAWIKKCKWYSTLSSEQLEEELGPWIKSLKNALPLTRQQEINEFMTNPLMFKTLGEELEDDPQYLNELKQSVAFPDIPTIIIGRDPIYSIYEMINSEGLKRHEAEEIENIWQELIHAQRTLNENTRYILAKDAGHNIHKDNPMIIQEAAFSLL
jgi:pimeloyl-ACP methyl ester carboxylesterase